MRHLRSVALWLGALAMRLRMSSCGTQMHAARHANWGTGVVRLDNYTLPKFLAMVRESDKHVALIKYHEVKETYDKWHKAANDKYQEMQRMKGMIVHDHYHPGQEALMAIRDVLEELTIRLHPYERLLICEVNVPDWDAEPDGPHYEEQYGLDGDHFPNYILYDKNNPKGKIYHGQDDAEQIAMWVDVSTDIEVKHDTLKDFDHLVYMFIIEKKRDEALRIAKDHGAELGDRKVVMYIKAMEKIMEKGDDWVYTESTRTSKILEKPLPADSRAEMTNKMKVLEVFKRMMRKLDREL